MIPQTVETRVTIDVALSSRTWRAHLPNGRPVLAFRPEDAPPLELAAGAQPRALLTVCDFSRALVLAEEEAADAFFRRPASGSPD